MGASIRNISAGEAFVKLVSRDQGAMAMLEKVGKKLESMGALAKAAGLALLKYGSIATAALGAAVAVFAKTGDAIHKMSIRTRTGAEQLTALQFAADKSGTSIDQVAQAMFRANRRIGNAISGTGPAVRALDELGLSAEKLSQMSGDQQFLALVGALEQVENEARRNQLAFEIFGDNFRQLQPLMAEGKDGIEALMAEARKLGSTMSDEDVAAAAKFTDAMGALKAQLMTLVRNIGASVAPALTSLLERMQPLLATLTNWETFWNRIDVLWRTGVNTLANYWDTFTVGVGVSFAIMIQKVQEAIVKLLNQIQKAGELIPGNAGLAIQLGAHETAADIIGSHGDLEGRKTTAINALKGRIKNRNADTALARQRLDQSIAALNARRSGGGAGSDASGGGGFGPGTGEGFAEGSGAFLEELFERAGAEVGRLSSVGTFSGQRLGASLGGFDVDKQQLDKLSEAVRLLQKIERKGGGVFA